MGKSSSGAGKSGGRSGKCSAGSSKKSVSNKTSKAARRALTNSPGDAATSMRTAYTPGGLSCVTAKSIHSSGASTKSAKTAKSTRTPPAGPRSGIPGNIAGSGKSDKRAKSSRSGSVAQAEKQVDSIFRETSQHCDQVHSRAVSSLHTAISSAPKRTGNTISNASTVSPVTPRTPVAARSAVDTPKSSRITRPCMLKTPEFSGPKTAKSPFHTAPRTALSATSSARSMADKTAKESRLHERTIGALKQGTVFGQSRVTRQATPEGVSAKDKKAIPSKTMRVPVCITPVHRTLVPQNTPATPTDEATPVKTAFSPSWMACNRTTASATPDLRTAQSNQLTSAPKSARNTVNTPVSTRSSKSSAGPNKTIPPTSNVRRNLFGRKSSKSAKSAASRKSGKSGKKSRKSGKSSKTRVKMSQKSQKSTGKKTMAERSGSLETVSQAASGPEKQKNDETIVWTATTAEGFNVVVRMGIRTVADGQKEEILTTKKIVVKGEKVFDR